MLINENQSHVALPPLEENFHENTAFCCAAVSLVDRSYTYSIVFRSTGFNRLKATNSLQSPPKESFCTWCLEIRTWLPTQFTALAMDCRKSKGVLNLRANFFFRTHWEQSTIHVPGPTPFAQSEFFLLLAPQKPDKLFSHLTTAICWVVTRYLCRKELVIQNQDQTFLPQIEPTSLPLGHSNDPP